MKTVGVITEYNPFHNGHEFHIAEAKRITGADTAIVVMSGDFVQRGTPAIMDKYIRTKAALMSGADIVFELPVCFATASAEYFAEGGIALLDSLGIVDSICFGSEHGEIEPLIKIAKILILEPPEYQAVLRVALKKGKTFPLARKEALKEYLGKQDASFISYVDSPNNLLGIEYCKALLQRQSRMIPYAVKRLDAGYHTKSLPIQSFDTLSDNIGETDFDASLSPKIKQFSSATSIRRILEQSPEQTLQTFIPEAAYHLYKEAHNKVYPILADDLSLLLNYKLLTTKDSEFSDYLDITPELANRLCSIKGSCRSFTEYAMKLKSKQLTLTRCNRILLHLLLGITSEHMVEYRNNGSALYARLLGFRTSASVLLRQISDTPTIPMITKTADAVKYMSPLAMRMLSEDFVAAELYSLLVYQKYGHICKTEYTQGIIKL